MGRAPERSATLGLVLVAICIAAVSFGLFTARAQLTALRSTDREDVAWLASQIELEHYHYQRALSVASVQPRSLQDDLDREIRRRFDIYYSRVDILLAFFRNAGSLDTLTHDAEGQLARVREYRDTVAGRLDESSSLTPTLVDSLLADSEQVAGLHRSLTMAAIQTATLRDQVAFGSAEQRLSAVLAGLYVLLAALLVHSLVLVMALRRLRSQLRLAEVERDNLRATISAAPIPLLICDCDGTIRSANAIALELLRSPEPPVQGTRLQGWIAPPDAPTEGAVLADANDLRSSDTTTEWSLRRFDGTVIPVAIRVSQVGLSDRETLCLVGLTDLSDSVRLQANLRHAREEAAAAQKARRSFQESVNHTLRTPLHTLLGSLEAMENNASGEAGLSADLGQVRTAAQDAVAGAEALLQRMEGDRPPAAPDPAAPVPEDAEAPPRTVLVVEDHPANRRLLCDAVAKLGCAVAAASDGQEAISEAEAFEYDVILLDLNLPDIPGGDVAKRIRGGDGPSARAKICAVSAHVRDADRPWLEAAGIDFFLKKPVTADQLRACLDDLARRADQKTPAPERPTIVADTWAEAVSGLGEAEAARLLQGVFLETEDLLDAVAQGPDPDRIAELSNASHRVCGLCAILGLGALSAALANLEDALSEPGTPRLPEVADACREALRETRTSLVPQAPAA
jgi:CheY-like chemotaxis protein/PAS domain-containing protein